MTFIFDNHNIHGNSSVPLTFDPGVPGVCVNSPNLLSPGVNRERSSVLQVVLQAGSEPTVSNVVTAVTEGCVTQ